MVRLNPGCRADFRPGVFRFSSVELRAALGLLFMFTPILDDLPRGDLIEAGLLALAKRISRLLAMLSLRRASGRGVVRMQPDHWPRV